MVIGRMYGESQAREQRERGRSENAGVAQGLAGWVGRARSAFRMRFAHGCRFWMCIIWARYYSAHAVRLECGVTHPTVGRWRHPLQEMTRR